MTAPPEELALNRDSYDKGPGERLREARIAADLSLEELSARLHLDTRRIEFLEADDFSQLPAPTFVRGYLRSYARLLGLPPGPIIEAFDRRGFAPPALIADIATQAETRSTDFWVVVVSVGIAALLVILAAVWFQTQRGDDFDGAAGTSEVVEPVPATGDGSVALSIEGAPIDAAPSTIEGSIGSSKAPSFTTTSSVDPTPATAVATLSSPGAGNRPNAGENGADPATTTVGATTNEPLSQSGAPPEPSSESSTQATTSRPGSGQSTQSDTGAPSSGTGAVADSRESTALRDSDVGAESAPNPGAAQTGGSTGASDPTAGPIDTVSMRFTREVWVEMNDGSGKRLYFNLAQPGKHIEVQGVRPIKVVIGNVKGVQVEYNGAPFDFSAYVTKGIARFEFRP